MSNSLMDTRGQANIETGASRIQYEPLKLVVLCNVIHCIYIYIYIRSTFCKQNIHTVGEHVHSVSFSQLDTLH
jgi:hypothetical protein